jgi:hypothetical protein
MVWKVFSSEKDYPPVLVGQEEGFVDLAFQISQKHFRKSGIQEFLVKGNLNGSRVGFSIRLLSEWRPQSIEGIDEVFYWGGAYFESIGQDSWGFLNSLAGLYGTPLSGFEAHDRVFARVVGLACNPGKLKSTPCKMKFFFNPEDAGGLYSEVFIKIDLEANTLEFNEKDNEYRAPLLRSLSRQVVRH